MIHKNEEFFKEWRQGSDKIQEAQEITVAMRWIAGTEGHDTEVAVQRIETVI